MIGILEYWSTGVLDPMLNGEEQIDYFPVLCYALLHHSIIPALTILHQDFFHLVFSC
jgi:hypothetical protein